MFHLIALLDHNKTALLEYTIVFVLDVLIYSSIITTSLGHLQLGQWAI